MKMKLNLYKILLSSLIFVFTNSGYSATLSDLIHTWKQKTGYLILGIPVRIDDINPIKSVNAHTKLTLPLIFEPLVTVNAKQELQPVLAESWHIASNNKSILLKIRPGHFFSDNTEVTAQDIVASIYRACSPVSQISEELKGLIGCVENASGKQTNIGIQTLGKYELKFDINSNPTTFLYQLASPSIAITKQTPSGLKGSGPYVLRENKHFYLVLERNKFASKENSANNSGIVLFYLNQKDILSHLKNDKPDGAIMYRSDDIWNLNDPNYNKVKINPNTTEILVLNNQHYPFNKLIVRQALAATIYNNFDNSCLPGAHKPYGIIPYGTGGSIDNTPPNSLPVITPAEVFSKVPELKNKTVTITIHQLEDLQRDCESDQIIKAAAQFNIKIKFQYHKTYSSLEELYINHHLDGFIELYVFRNREAYSILQFFSTAGENNANINDMTLDSMLNEAITSPSSHGRFQVYRKITQYIQNQGILIPLFYMDHSNILSKCVTGTSENFLFNPFLHIPQLHKIQNCQI